jgi:hypothetical protein
MSIKRARETKVNTAFSGVSKFGWLSPAHMLPLAICLIFGVGVAKILLNRSDIETLFWCAGPFFGYIAAVRDNTGRFFARGKKPPNWKVRRRRHQATFKKHRTSAMIRR